MKINKIISSSLLAAGFVLTLPMSTIAGNEDRAGSAGATELLINPFAKSSGWADAATASAEGLDALYLNVAGIAFTKKTEIHFTRTSWLSGAGVNINALGLTQRIGESSVLGLSLMAMDFGDLQITTTELPEGGIGTFSPQYTNLSLAYAKEFSNSIYGGINFKVISESIADIRAQGIAFDAGIRYVTGETDNIKFGIALRNVGPPMSYEGDGFSIVAVPQGVDDGLALEQRSGRFELPSQVNIGVSYDFNLAEMHKLTAAGNFQSNSFTKDRFLFGANYGFITGKANFGARLGYAVEQRTETSEGTILTSALTGPTAGVSVEVPMGTGGTLLAIDYSYRTTNPFNGVHGIGIRILVGAASEGAAE